MTNTTLPEFPSDKPPGPRSETHHRESTAPAIIELTTELSELNLFCPFCGHHVYDWADENCVLPCKHLIFAASELQTVPGRPYELGDVVFCICDSGPRPDVQILAFRDEVPSIH